MAQTPALSSGEIYAELQKLNTLGSVLYIAAHPDDENTRLISWLVGEKKYRTAYLSLTRGDGGQNLVGKELGPPLGLIRSQELLAARRVDGAEQFFTRAYDFGFSKNADETLRLWQKDSVLYDMVWVIRNFKPDVIICRFPPNADAGHGHHATSAILAKEAFKMAADPNVFPEQLAYVPVWKTKRLFWNTYNFGTVNTTSEQQITVNVGVFNPVTGKSYGEVAAESRSQHKSQGFGSASNRGEIKEYFVQWEGDSARGDLFSNILTDWKRIKGAETFQASLQKVLNQYGFRQPSASVKDLLLLRSQLKSLLKKAVKGSEDAQWLNYQAARLDKIIVQAAGVWVEAVSTKAVYTHGDSLKFQWEAVSRYPGKVQWINAIVQNKTLSISKTAALEKLEVVKDSLVLSDDTPFSSPYWLEQPIADGIFHLNNILLSGMPENKASVATKWIFSIENDTFEIQLPMLYRYLDPKVGDRYEPIRIVPPVTIQAVENVLLFAQNKTAQLKVKVKAYKDVNGTLEAAIPLGWESGNSQVPTFDLKAGQEKILNIELQSLSENTADFLYLNAQVNGKKYPFSLQEINYDHIPVQTILQPCKVKLLSLNVNKTLNRIGYIPGAGDEIPAALEQLGYEVVMLDENYPLSEGFKGLDAIVSGVRAYNTHAYLNQWYEPLMKFIENGGRLLIQYNTNNRIGPIVAKMTPNVFNITRDRVTEEDAVVNYTDSASFLLKKPNQITAKDFEHWVQERGIYFVGEKDAAWKTLLLMNDKGEKPLDGSVIYAPYGKGYIVYTGLSFFRQLPAGVPGAYRLFVNLLESVSDSK
jgi:LmbE family N-acetylglucosaminyl deacetylase